MMSKDLRLGKNYLRSLTLKEVLKKTNINHVHACTHSHFIFWCVHNIADIWQTIYSIAIIWSKIVFLIVTKSDWHYVDVIMTTMASQITGVSIVHSTVCSGADKWKHRSSASLVFVRGIHRWPVNSPHKELVQGKIFFLMTSSWV